MPSSWYGPVFQVYNFFCLKGVFAKKERGFLSMITVCNTWKICLELNLFFYDPSLMLQHSEFVWTLRSPLWVVFNNFLLIDATDRSKIRSDLKRLFFVVSTPFSIFANTPFKGRGRIWFWWFGGKKWKIVNQMSTFLSFVILYPKYSLIFP